MQATPQVDSTEEVADPNGRLTGHDSHSPGLEVALGRVEPQQNPVNGLLGPGGVVPVAPRDSHWTDRSWLESVPP